MARPVGARNADYDQERVRLLQKAKARLLSKGGTRASFRDLAAAAEVSPATLRHYFSDREGLIGAVLEQAHREGLPFLMEAASAPTVDLGQSLTWFFERLLLGWRQFGVGRIYEMGLGAGLGDESLGPAYVNEMLEPTLQALEARLARHVAQGQMRRCDLRHAALALLSPVLLALLHQDGLGGTRCRPLDVKAFLADHLDRFVAAYGEPGAKAA